MKKATAFITAVVMAVGAGTVCASALNGDINGDGSITVSDISSLAAHVKGKKPLPHDVLARADVNGDGSVTVTDISAIAAHVKGKKAIKQDEENDKRSLTDYDFGQLKEAMGGKYDVAVIPSGQTVTAGMYNFDVFPNTYFIMGINGSDAIVMDEPGKFHIDRKIFDAIDDSTHVEYVQVHDGGKIGRSEATVGMKYSELKTYLDLGKAHRNGSFLSPVIETEIDGEKWELIFNDEATREAVRAIPNKPDSQMSEDFTFEELGIDPVCTYAMKYHEGRLEYDPTFYSFGKLKEAMGGKYEVGIAPIGQAAATCMYNYDIFPNMQFIFLSMGNDPIKMVDGKSVVDREEFEKTDKYEMVYMVQLLPGAEINHTGAEVGMKYSEIKEHISLGQAYKTNSMFSPVIEIMVNNHKWYLVFADPEVSEALKDINGMDMEKFNFEDYGVDPQCTLAFSCG